MAHWLSCSPSSLRHKCSAFIAGGVQVGLIQAGLDEPDRRAAYQADITYVTNSELGFGAPAAHHAP